MASQPTSNLPFQTNPFVGRERELAEILHRLHTPGCRLLTVMGPGGVGKTRLALEVAQQQWDRFPDNVYWVDLQSGQTTDFLITAVAGVLTLSLSGRDDPCQQLLRHLRHKTLLLVLDNFEGLLESAGLLGEIVQECPTVKLLVTSRAALHLQEEWLYPVSGLPYPPAQQDTLTGAEIETFAAVQLFVERARRVRPGFSLGDERAGLLHICRLVEGLPLALELAAGWARGLDCATIAAEIARNLTFLTSSLRNVSHRHRSMAAVFAHSWTLLSPAEQTVFTQLALFRGGFRRQAAEAVTGATAPLLTALLDKSLLRWQADGRYHMHELLRQYAEGRLGQTAQEAEQARHRHAAYYLDFLQQRHDAMLGGRQQEAAAEIAAELANIRLAWGWAVQNQMVARIGGAVEALAMFCHSTGRYRDAAGMYEEALHTLAAGERGQQQVRALILAEMGWIAIRLGKFAKANQLFRECLNLYHCLALPPLPGQGTDPLLGLSTLASIEGDYDLAADLAQQARRTAVTHNHANNLQTANYQLASIAHARGEYEAARTFAQAAYAACQQTGDQWFMAYCLNEMGRAALALDDVAAAQRHFEAGYKLRQAFADPEGMALALRNLGNVTLRQQQIAEAQDLFARSASLYREIDDKGGLAAAHHGLAKTAVAHGDDETAQKEFRQALTIAAGIGFTPLLLAVLAAIGQFLVRTGLVAQGLALLALVQQQPAADQETHRLAHQQLQQAQETISPDLLAAAEPPADLATAVTVAQAALSSPILPHPEKSLPPAAAPLLEPLTDRELEVLHLLAQGLTNREIAQRLTIVIGTVKAHNNSIFAKLGVKNRARAVARARAYNLL